MGEPDLADLTRTPLFDDRTWDLAEAVLGDLDGPTRLSAVLARVTDAALDDARSNPMSSDLGDMDADGGRDLTVEERVSRACHLVALLAAKAYDPDVTGARSERRERVLVVLSDGAPLDAPWVAGDDLLLVPAVTASVEEGRVQWRVLVMEPLRRLGLGG